MRTVFPRDLSPGGGGGGGGGGGPYSLGIGSARTEFPRNRVRPDRKLVIPVTPAQSWSEPAACRCTSSLVTACWRYCGVGEERLMEKRPVDILLYIIHVHIYIIHVHNMGQFTRKWPHEYGPDL